MKSRLLSLVKEFLDLHWDQSSPLLIACSGGPDSKTLLHTALRWGKAELHVAHVDHGWREESAKEALELGKEVEALGLRFHTTRLAERTTEDEARQCRLAYYRTLREEIPYQAVLLGHQANDLAETVLKRLFEGAQIHSLAGMRPVSSLEGILLWRPLLWVERGEIEEYLSLNQLFAIKDPANDDPKYLRARMRSETIPLLERSFGKNFLGNLLELSRRSDELDRYLSARVNQLLPRAVQEPFGWSIDARGIERVELRLLIQHVAEQEGFSFSRALLEELLDALFEGKPNRWAEMAHRKILIERGHFFLLAPEFEKKELLSELLKGKIGRNKCSFKNFMDAQGPSSEVDVMLEEGCMAEGARTI